MSTTACAITNGTSTCNCKLSIEVRELQYRGRDRGVPLWRKWLYVLLEKDNSQKIELVDEIYVGIKPGAGDMSEPEWRRMKDPGIQADPWDNDQATSIEPNRYCPRELDGCTYHFFLSPMQLRGDVLDRLCQEAQQERKKRGPITRSDAGLLELGESESIAWGGKGDLEYVTSRARFDVVTDDRNHRLTLPDPFAWAEDIQEMGYQPALELYREYHQDEERLTKHYLASVIVGAMKSGADIEDELEDDPRKFFRRENPDGELRTPWILENRHVRKGGREDRFQDHNIAVDDGDWRSAPDSAKSAMDLFFKFDGLNSEAFGKNVNENGLRLAKWLEGKRHRIVDLEAAASHPVNDPSGPDENYLHGVIHWAKATLFASESTWMQKFIHRLLEADDTTERYPRRLFPAKGAAQGAYDETEKYFNRLKACAASAIQLYVNLAPAITATRTVKDGARVTRSWLTKFGARNLTTAADVFTGTRMVTPRMYQDLRRLQVGNAAEFAEQLSDNWDGYRARGLSRWVTGGAEFGMRALAILDAIFILRQALSGRATTEEQISAVASISGIVVEDVIVRWVKRASDEKALLRVVSAKSKWTEFGIRGALYEARVSQGSVFFLQSTRARLILKGAGGVLGAVGGFADFYIAVHRAGRAMVNENYGERTGWVFVATGAVLTVFAAVATALGMAASGPIGWLVLAGMGFLVIGGIIVWVFEDDAWKLAVNNCYFGKRNDLPDGKIPPCMLLGPRVEGRSSRLGLSGEDKEKAEELRKTQKIEAFRNELARQRQALAYLLTRFKVTFKPSGLIVIEPGTVSLDTTFELRLKLPYGHGNDALRASVHCYPYANKATVVSQQGDDQKLRLKKELWDANSFREQDGRIKRFGIQLAASGEYGSSTRWMQEYRGSIWARLGAGEGRLAVPTQAIQFAARPNQVVEMQVAPAN